MANRTATLLKGEKSKKTEMGVDRAANTIRLRKKYTKFAIEQQIEGQSAPPFKEWAKKNFPNVKILETE